jgi:hypothetical protein
MVHHGSVTAERDAEPDANAIQGDYGESWLEALAASCGILHGRPTTLDLEKADVELTLRAEVDGTYNPTVKAQVKTTTSLRNIDADTVSYDLDVVTYDVLRRDDHSVRRVLVVFGLPVGTPRVRLQDDGTLLLGRGVWTSLEGRPATTNRNSTVIELPLANTIDEEGLRAMLSAFGTRRSTIVPALNEWEDA